MIKPRPSTITNQIGMTFNLIPAGEFLMGTSEEILDDPYEPQYLDERPQHRVHITRDFYLQTTSVTQQHWRSVMESEPWQEMPNVREGDDYPATYISWDDAVEFCLRLSQFERFSYRLPTEAEWEYTCRAGTQTIYSFEQNAFGDYAWWMGNTYHDLREHYAHRVGQKLPNRFGLFDMLGNVWEWCQDCYGSKYYASSPSSDPAGPATGIDRVSRGGGWFSDEWGCRSAARYANTPEYRDSDLGFRVLRVLHE